MQQSQTDEKSRFLLVGCMPSRRRRVKKVVERHHYSQAIINKALRLHRHGRFTFREIANRTGVTHASTVMWWTRKCMTRRARKERSAHCGRRHVLNARQEPIARGWLIYRNSFFLHTNTARFLDFLEHLIGHRPRTPWLSRWLKRSDMSRRIVQPTVPPMLSRNAHGQGADFIRALRAQRKHPH